MVPSSLLMEISRKCGAVNLHRAGQLFSKETAKMIGNEKFRHVGS
jgi:hypothetical protein